MSSVYILLIACVVVGVNSDEHNHIVSSIIFLHEVDVHGRTFVCVTCWFHNVN
jgi:hypothetical protein